MSDHYEGVIMLDNLSDPYQVFIMRGLYEEPF